ncbi:hypothetical protein AM1_1999 [Acaryochloris marina MBIC11017]|uniref:Uncharacterized protein n=1 Tax=Acaryochloris marina (strain MBIC 11017) TaxID=329726 RepID=B0CFJ5_ACAM1|nr:hypothetical protein AM1_1999 [Acaryochloris marina MBIC11017]
MRSQNQTDAKPIVLVSHQRDSGVLRSLLLKMLGERAIEN